LAVNKQRNAIFKIIHALEDHICNISKNGKPLMFICGDLNGADTTPLRNAYQLRQINNEATRDNNVLDVIITNAPECYTLETLPAIGTSDHKVVWATSSNANYKQTRPKQTKTLTRSGKIKDTVAVLRTHDRGSLVKKVALNSTSNCQESFNELYNIIQTAEDTMQPLKITKRRGDQPWLNNTKKESIKKRQKLFHTRRFEEWSKISKEIEKKISAAKRQYYSNFTNGNVNTWKEINATRKPKIDQSIDKDLALEQNECFYNVWSGIKQPDISSFILKRPPPDCPQPFNEQIVLKAIEKQKNGAFGPDGLSSKLLKSARLELATIIGHLFNASLRLSYVPTQWKSANITPIPKVAHPKEGSDYRPKALTSTLCKIFERVIAKTILEYTRNIWEINKQYGFLPGRSTMDAIVKVIEDWSHAKDQRLPTQAVFFDFAKAFDLVNHHTLLTKLQVHLPPWLVSWIAA